MIHTLEFYTNIALVEKEILERIHGRNIKEVIKKVNQQFSKFNIRIGKPMWNQSFNIYLQFDAVYLLERVNDGVIVEEDYDIIHSYMQQLEEQLFGVLSDKHFILNRIDYRLDLKVEDSKHRKILFKLWRKIAKRYGHLKKRNKKNSIKVIKNGREIYVSEKSYKTTIYLSSKALAVCLYDKEEERKSKGISPLPYEKNVLRFEVRLMPRHLAYKARDDRSRKKIRERNLECYMKRKCFYEYIQKYVLNIFGTENFHKLNVIKLKLSAAGIKEAQRNKLVNFINIIARSGVEGAIGYRDKKNKKRGNYSRYTMKRYRQILSELGIHMISLPLKTKGVGDILENPLGQWKIDNE